MQISVEIKDNEPQYSEAHLIAKANLYKKYNGKTIQETYKLPKDSRSARQQRYYYGVIVKILKDHFGESKEDMNDILKRKFNPRAVTMFQQTESGVKKETVVVGSSFEDLPTDKVEEKHEEIRIWATQEWGLRIPLPNEVESLENVAL